MLGEKLAELVNFIGEDKAEALSVHSAIESSFHVCYLNRKCLGYAIGLLSWKYDWPARIKSFSKTQCCFPLVLCMFCLFHVFILLKGWHLAENMLLFPKVPLILWIGYKSSTRCGRVHFEHRHRKWLVITVRPTTSVRKSPRKNLPPRNTPDSFCRRFTRQNHRCAAWAVFFFFTNKILCSCSIFQNLFSVVDGTTWKCYSCAWKK